MLQLTLIGNKVRRKKNQNQQLQKDDGEGMDGASGKRSKCDENADSSLPKEVVSC